MPTKKGKNRGNGGGGGSKGKSSKSKTNNAKVEEKSVINSNEDSKVLGDKLNEALILDDSTEIVVVNGNNNNNNNEKYNNKESKTAILTKSSSQSGDSLTSNLSPEVKPFVPSIARMSKSKSFGDFSPKKDPFEVSYSNKIYTSTYHRNSSRLNTSKVVEEEINKSGASEDLGVEEPKTIEDYVALGVPREIAETKHPLEHQWTFWYYLNDKSLSWDRNYVKLATVGTIEEFWQVYNHIEPASRISVGCDYSLFKYGIRPDWEDPKNQKGGRWIVEVPINSLSPLDIIDVSWIETLFILIGEHGAPYNDIVNGAVINMRKGKFRIGVWLKDGRNNFSGVSHIGGLLKERLRLSQTIYYSVHSEEQSKGGYGSKNSSRKMDSPGGGMRICV